MIDKMMFRELVRKLEGAQMLADWGAEIEAGRNADGWRTGLTIEPHGDGHAVYSGRDAQHHGHRLFNVTDATQVGLNVITGLINGPLPKEPGQ